MLILFQSYMTSSFFYLSFRQTHFILSGPLGGFTAPTNLKKHGFRWIRVFFGICCVNSNQVVLTILKSSVNWILPCRNLLRTNAMCTLSVFFWCWQILPSHMILTQIFPRCVHLHQTCGIYPVSQTAGNSKSYLLTVSMTTQDEA